jgi:hypothetical protein
LANLAIVFDLLAKDKASAALKNVGDQAQRTGKLSLGLGGAFKKLAGVVGGLLVFRQVASAIGGFVKDAAESAKIGRLTGAVLKSTGGAAKVTRKHVDDLATAISNKTGIDDEAIQSNENLLLTFTNVRNEVGKGNKIFDQATGLVTDMSVALGQSGKSSAIQLGKALNDPIKGVTALQRVGVSFTQSQKDQIATLVKSGDVLGAQKVILKEVGKEFGGAAAAAASPLDRLKVIAGNLGERFGTMLLPHLSRFADFLSKTAAPAVARFLDWLGPKFDAAMKFLGPAFIKIGKFLGDVFSGKWEKAGAQLKEWGSKVVAWIQNTAAPWIGEKLKLLGAKLEAWIRPRIPGMLAKLQELGNKIVGWISSKGLPLLGQWLGRMGARLQAWILPRIPGMIANLIKFGIAVNNWIIFKAIPMLVSGAAKMAVRFITEFYNSGRKSDLPGKVRGLITDMWDRAKAKLNDVIAGMKAKGKAVIQGLLDGMKAPFTALQTWVSGIATWIKNHKGPLSLDSTLLAPAGKALMGGLLHGLKVGFGPVGDFVYGVSGSVKSIISKIGSSIGAFFSGGVPGVTGSGGAGIRALARLLHTSLNHHIDPQGGNAYDIFGSGALNSKIAEALRLNHAKLGLRYVISQMRIASARSGWNWRAYHPITNQGDYRHTGHVHASYASGTLSALPGIARLAEKGAELVVHPQIRNMGGGGQRVFNARETKALLSDQGQGRPLVGNSKRPITIILDIGDRLTERIQGVIDENDEFHASVRRAR